MRWGRQWPERIPRPKVRSLTAKEQAGVVRSLEKGIAASPVLSAFALTVRAARGRFYIERELRNHNDEPYTEVWAVGGGRTLDHFAGRGGIWPAVVGGGRPPEKWRADGVAIRLE